MAKGKPPARPTRLRAPKTTEDIETFAKTVDKIVKAGRRSGKVSHNPATHSYPHLKVQRARGMPSAFDVMGQGQRTTPAPPVAMPTARELLEQTAPQAPPDPSTMTAAELFAATATPATEAFAEGMATATEEDRIEVISPPNTIFPERPRAREARYDRETNVLVVVFRNGGTYAYYGVPLATWRALQRNRSFGQTLDRLVNGSFPYEKIAF